MTLSARYNTDGLSEEQLAILAVAETFLSGIRLRDKALMLAQVLSEGGATLLRTKMSEPITPYEFWMDGTLDHVGTDIWSFVKRDGKWIISGLADNSRKPAE
ncbi:hypothetical protein K438DRAFT_1961558 [Mycena galopus ATCC 62051]|nr:hypothetical protein K438DRAFT_1961558 [Mycena galopus ATCC 62051]